MEWKEETTPLQTVSVWNPVLGHSWKWMLQGGVGEISVEKKRGSFFDGYHGNH